MPKIHLPPPQILAKKKREYIKDSGKKRVHIDLTEEEFFMICDLRDRMLASGYADVLRRFLPIMEAIVAAIEQGNRPVIINDELNELEVLEL